MFHLLSGCYPRSSPREGYNSETGVYEQDPSYVEPYFTRSRVANIAKGLDVVSALVLIIIGALIASGVMQGSPAGAYAMLAIGGLTFGRHLGWLFSDVICCVSDRVGSEAMRAWREQVGNRTK